jgi:predicted permease
MTRFRIFDGLNADIRYGLRSLFKNPAYTLVAVLSLALGIGATTAMFSLIYSVLIHPFPYADSDRIMNPDIVTIEGPPMRWFAMSRPQFEALGRARSIESLLGFTNENAQLMGGDLPEEVAVIHLTENADTFLGVPALLGRSIQPSDASGGGQHVAVLNYRFWQRHFQGDRAIVGRTLRIKNDNYTIVGVMPRTFAFNDTIGVGDVYLPFSLLHDSPVRAVSWIKLKPNVTPAAADAELDAIVHQFARENPRTFAKKFRLQLQPIIDPYRRSTSHTLILLLAAVVLLLAIGCANCSILLLARGEARQRELAVRSAIGAGRWRILRQLLVEALVISFSGAVPGVVFSYWLAKLPLQLSPDSFPPESVIQINVPILAFSVGLAFLCGIAFSLLPALRLSHPDFFRKMQGNTSSILSRTGKRRLNLLIAGQTALTLILLATAGAAIDSFLGLMRLPLGYNPENVMQAAITIKVNPLEEGKGVQSREGRIAYIEQIRQKIASVPGVESVAVGTASTPPFSGFSYPIEIAGITPNAAQVVRVHFVGPEFFSTLRIQLLQGRIWNEAENMRGGFVAVVNQAFARQYWGYQNPIGQQVRLPALKASGPFVLPSEGSDNWRQVLGVIADLRNDGLAQPAVPEVYVPYTTYMFPFVHFEIRTQSEPKYYLHSVRKAVQSVASDQPLSNVYDLEEAVTRDAQWRRQRLFSTLFGFFSTVALALTCTGLFSVVSYSAAQRIMEFGVRTALGAPRAHILWIATRVAIVSVAAGVTTGFAISVLIRRALAHWTGSSTAFGSIWLAIVLLIVCSLAACAFPARRAVSIQPVEALRYE